MKQKQKQKLELKQKAQSQMLDNLTKQQLQSLSQNNKEGAKKLLEMLKQAVNQDAGQQQSGDPDDPILSKIKTGLKNIIPTKYNVTDDAAPLIVNIQEKSGESLLNRHDLDYEDYCNVKQGYLGYVIETSESEKIGKKITYIKPVFAVLNQQTFSLFENENVKNLFKSFNMKYIKPTNIPITEWIGTHCWQVLRGKQPESSNLVSSDTPARKPEDNLLVSLCASDQNEMDKWIAAIRDFHNCDVKVAADDEKIQLPPKQQVQLDEDQIIETQRDAKDQEEIKYIDDNIDQLDGVIAQTIKAVKLQKLKHKQIIQEEDEKIQAMQEKDCQLTDNLIEMAEQNQLQAETAIGEKFKQKLKGLTDSKDLMDLEKQRMDRIIQEEDSSVSVRKALENNIRQTMMQQTEQFTQNFDSGSCYDDKLKSNLKDGIKQVCSFLYKPSSSLDVQDLLNCLNINTFCKSCCNGFLGVALFAQREQCMDQCDVMRTQQQGEIDMKIYTDNGISNHKFVYGAEKDKLDKKIAKLAGKIQ